MPELRSLESTDRAALEAALRSDDTFRDDEVAVALELIDDALGNDASDYWFRVAMPDGQGEQDQQGGGDEPPVLGYICYGPTPMTESSFDLYWIVVHAAARGRGIARLLIEAMEAHLGQKGASGIRIETSQLESYGSARRVYERHRYVEVGRIPDFYRGGDDLVTFYKRL